ncbi:MAG: hypothetical protein EA425_12515 [Puniceicoccaceae bacterium]|nr:MAG: hypothetical protein EA425_12515 [Puniceicoccaceae bacterium]
MKVTKSILAISTALFIPVLAFGQAVNLTLQRELFSPALPSNAYVGVLKADASIGAAQELGGLVMEGVSPFENFLSLVDLFDWNHTVSARPAEFPVHFSQNNMALPEGARPFVLFTTSPIDQITSDDMAGLFTTSVFRVAPLGADALTTARLDTAVLGRVGSYELVAIPEPRVFALLAGLGALGFVVIRRFRK